MSKNPIYIFDKSDNLLAITINYIEAPFEEDIYNEQKFEIIFPFNDNDAEYLVEGNQVAFKDLDNKFRLFIIREIDDENGSLYEKKVICFSSSDELKDAIIEDQRPQDKTLLEVVTSILANTRWQVGDIEDFGLQSTNFYYINVSDALKKAVNIWGGELIDRVELNDIGISGRFIDVVFRRGAEKGKRFEIDKDIEKIKRTILYYPKTALYGKGRSLQTENGGYTRKITFSDIEWSIANGDPTDKPLGQEWVGNQDVLEKHGIDNNGVKIHRFGLFEDAEEDDKNVLLSKTWEELKERSKPQAKYSMSVNTFYGISGYEHEQVLLGDTSAIIDKKIKPAILLEARVIRLKYDIGDPSNGEVILGNYLELNDDTDKLNRIEKQLSNGLGIWNSVEDPIADNDFPDTIPPTPTNFIAYGLFRQISLRWDYETSSYIAAYEVYASQTTGFVPDNTNLIFKGKSGGFSFKAGINEQWYFKIRSINTHDTPSSYSNEISTNTIRVDADDILPSVITNELIAENAAIDFAKIANVLITNAMINNASIDFAKIKDVLITNAMIENVNAEKINVGTLEGHALKGVNISTTGTNGNISLADDKVTSEFIHADGKQSVSQMSAGLVETMLISDGGTLIATSVLDADNIYFDLQSGAEFEVSRWGLRSTWGISSDKFFDFKFNETTNEMEMFATNGFRFADPILTSGFAVASLLNGWVEYGQDNLGETYYYPAYMKDAQNMIHIRGSMKGGTNARVFTLPEGHRPAYNLYYMVVCGTNTVGTVTIKPNGGVFINVSDNTYVSLDNISPFMAEL